MPTGRFTIPFFTAWGRQQRPRYSSPYRTAWGRHVVTPSSPPAAAKPAAPGAPAAPPAARPSARLPVDPVYDQTVAGLARQRDDTLAGLAQQQTGTLADYGYGATFDPQGNVTGLSFYPANPFSRAALLRRNYQQSKTGTQNSMAARGQLYSGALVNAQNTNDVGYLQGENALQNAVTQALIAIARRRSGAGTDYELGVGGAGAERAARAASSDTGEQAFAGAPPPPAAAKVTTRGPRGEPVVTIRGKRYYRRTSDNKLIPLF